MVSFVCLKKSQWKNIGDLQLHKSSWMVINIFLEKGKVIHLVTNYISLETVRKDFFFFIFCYISLYTACGLVLDLILKKKRCYSEYRFLIVLHDAMASYLIGNSNPGKCTNKYIGTLCLRLRAVENHGRLCQLTRRMLLMKIKKIKWSIEL